MMLLVLIKLFVVYAFQIEGRYNSNTSNGDSQAVVYAFQIEGRYNVVHQDNLRHHVVYAFQIEGRYNMAFIFRDFAVLFMPFK